MVEKRSEKIFRILFLLSAYATIVVSIGIVVTLVEGAFYFFSEYSFFSFITGTQWSPNAGIFGMLPLLMGTLQVMLYSSIIALPFGLLIAIYLSQFASSRSRNILKPLLEILAGIPSIIYGFFAYNFINPLVSDQPYSVLGASISLGIMLIPMVASLSEDALRAVPVSITEASLGLGTTRFETISKIIVPASLSGIMASFILAISRALGETMIVSLAAGSVASMAFNPTQGAMTMTGAIVQTSGTDATLSSPEYTVLYAIGIMLFLFTLSLNMFSKWIIRKYKVSYN